MMGDKTYQFDYTVKCMPIAGGNGAYWEEYGMHPAMGEMHTSDLFGYNTADGKLHCFTVDNMGESRDQICDWKSSDHLSIEYDGLKDGKEYNNKMDLSFTGDDILDFSAVSSVDGKVAWSGSGTFHKVNEK
jgi:hypothetical protein